MDFTATRAPSQGIPWDAQRARCRVLVFGAGGAVGRELVLALLAAGHPPARLALFARTRRVLEWRGQRIPVEPLPGALPPGELAFLCTPPELALRLAAPLAANGTRVVDLSGALRREREVPLALDEVGGHELGAFTDMVALPLRTTALIAPPLFLLERAVGLAEVDLFALVSAAHEGAQGVLALRAEVQHLAARGGAPPAAAQARVGNLLRPRSPVPGGFEGEIAEELQRLLARPDLLLDVAAMAGDLERCDFFAVKLLLHAPLDPAGVPELFEACGAIEVVSDEDGPIPALCVGSGRVHVGRIRAGSRGPRSLCFVAAGDQLRAGASHAALKVAARLPLGL